MRASESQPLRVGVPPDRDRGPGGRRPSLLEAYPGMLSALATRVRGWGRGQGQGVGGVGEGEGRGMWAGRGQGVGGAGRSVGWPGGGRAEFSLAVPARTWAMGCSCARPARRAFITPRSDSAAPHAARTCGRRRPKPHPL